MSFAECVNKVCTACPGAVCTTMDEDCTTTWLGVTGGIEEADKQNGSLIVGKSDKAEIAAFPDSHHGTCGLMPGVTLYPVGEFAVFDCLPGDVLIKLDHQDATVERIRAFLWRWQNGKEHTGQVMYQSDGVMHTVEYEIRPAPNALTTGPLALQPENLQK